MERTIQDMVISKRGISSLCKELSSLVTRITDSDDFFREELGQALPHIILRNEYSYADKANYLNYCVDTMKERLGEFSIPEGLSREESKQHLVRLRLYMLLTTIRQWLYAHPLQTKARPREPLVLRCTNAQRETLRTELIRQDFLKPCNSETFARHFILESEKMPAYNSRVFYVPLVANTFTPFRYLTWTGTKTELVYFIELLFKDINPSATRYDWPFQRKPNGVLLRPAAYRTRYILFSSHFLWQSHTITPHQLNARYQALCLNKKTGKPRAHAAAFEAIVSAVRSPR